MRTATTAALAMLTAVAATVSVHSRQEDTGQEETTWRGLTLQAEDGCADTDPYDRDDYAYPQSREQDIQNEMGATAGGWYGMYEARIFASSAETDIEHIVAAAEAHRSGLCGRTAEEKTAFANDLNNLTLASPDLNRNEKSDKDAAEWLPPNARCWFARTVVFVKRTHDLTVDEAERDELERVLSACESGEVPARVAEQDTATTTTATDHPPVQTYGNCASMREAGWDRGVNRSGGTYRDSWNDAEIRTYNLNTARDRDNDGHACE